MSDEMERFKRALEDNRKHMHEPLPEDWKKRALAAEAELAELHAKAAHACPDCGEALTMSCASDKCLGEALGNTPTGTSQL